MNQDFEKQLNRIGSRIGEAQKKLDNAIQINQLQKHRLISYEDELLALGAELKFIEKRMNKKKFSLLNFFKLN